MTRLVLLWHPSTDKTFRSIVAFAIAEAEEEGWTIDKIPFGALAKVTRFGMVKGSDAERIYKHSHAERVGVLALHPPVVDSWGGQPNPRLGTVLRYNAWFRITPNAEKVKAAVEGFKIWMARPTPIDRPTDPRILPLHLFARKEVFDDLDTPAGQKRFHLKHRRAGCYFDDVERDWEVPHASQMHGVVQGTGPAVVDGYPLQAGYHWDVQSGRKSTPFRTLSGTRTIPAGGHLNVYPDGEVRA